MAYSGNCTGVIEHNWERPTFNKQLNKTTMNKSKFKSVNWKHGNTQMHSLMENDCKYYWQSDLFPFAGKHGFMKVPEDFIEQYPELFEVEKAERKFEEGAYYWAKVWKWSDWDAVKYSHGVFYFVGVPTGFAPNRLYLIGGKIGK